MATAFVVEDSHYNKDSDGEMDEHKDDFAWVFPEGVDVGHPAQYYEKRYRASGFPRYGDAGMTYSRSELLAEGTVASVDGANVTFRWERAASQSDGGAWHATAAPTATLQRQEENRFEHEGGGRNDFGRRRGKSSRGRTAVQRDGFRIRAPEAAWKLVRRLPTFVATLVSGEVQADGQLALVLTTLGGEDIQVAVAQDSSVAAVAALLREQRGLDAEVQIVAINGTKLALQTEVQTIIRAS